MSLIAVSAIGLFATSSFAQSSDNSTAEPAAAQHPTSTDAAATESSAVGESGMVVVRDPTTGKLRAPEPAEARAMAAKLAPLFNMSTDGLKEEKLPNGGFKKDLKGRFQSAAVAKRNSDGSTSWECAENADQAAKFLTEPSQSTSTPEEK
ncbi:MAG: hypothetical protein ABI451_01450 [Dokdonella sp.]